MYVNVYVCVCVCVHMHKKDKEPKMDSWNSMEANQIEEQKFVAQFSKMEHNMEEMQILMQQLMNDIINTMEGKGLEEKEISPALSCYVEFQLGIRAQ